MTASKKSAITRQRIIDSAIELFCERGFEGTTMRDIASRAEVSVGNSYYYFKSKEELVQGFYSDLQNGFRVLAEPIFQRTDDLTDRLIALMNAQVEMFTPYHVFAGTFIRSAANPNSSTSPFSSESSEARELSIQIFKDALDGSKAKVPAEIRAELPELLWLFHMGVILFWVYDKSKNQRRTKLLIRKSVPIVTRLIGLTRVPVFKSIAIELVRSKTEIMSIQ